MFPETLTNLEYMNLSLNGMPFRLQEIRNLKERRNISIFQDLMKFQQK
jgi:hypothetical protein